MTVKSHVSNQDDTVTISIDGKFDFSSISEFRQAYAEKKHRVNNYVVDMRHAQTMDSSALGMLMNMKKYLNKQDRDIRIINCSPALKKIFLIARFDKMFNIE